MTDDDRLTRAALDHDLDATDALLANIWDNCKLPFNWPDVLTWPLWVGHCEDDHHHDHTVIPLGHATAPQLQRLVDTCPCADDDERCAKSEGTALLIDCMTELRVEHVGDLPVDCDLTAYLEWEALRRPDDVDDGSARIANGNEARW